MMTTSVRRYRGRLQIGEPGPNALEDPDRAARLAAHTLRIRSHPDWVEPGDKELDRVPIHEREITVWKRTPGVPEPSTTEPLDFPAWLADEVLRQKVAEICSHYGVVLEEILGRGRHEDTSHARQEVAFLLRASLGLTFEGIGQLLGGRHHATMIYLVEQGALRRLQRGLEAAA